MVLVPVRTPETHRLSPERYRARLQCSCSGTRDGLICELCSALPGGYRGTFKLQSQPVTPKLL